MRKILTAALCLMAALCLCTGALAADMTLLSREAENSNDDDYFYPQQLLAVGDTLDRAYTRAVYIEDAAKAYSIALSHGPVKVIDRADVQRMLGK